MQKHWWFTKTSCIFSKNNLLPGFARHFSSVPTTTRNMHNLTWEQTVCNVKVRRIRPCACLEKIFSSSSSSRLTSSQFHKVSIFYVATYRKTFFIKLSRQLFLKIDGFYIFIFIFYKLGSCRCLLHFDNSSSCSTDMG